MCSSSGRHLRIYVSDCSKQFVIALVDGIVFCGRCALLGNMCENLSGWGASRVSAQLMMIVLALVGYSYLWLAILSDVGAMLIVTLNSMTVLGDPRHYAKNLELQKRAEEARVKEATRL